LKVVLGVATIGLSIISFPFLKRKLSFLLETSPVLISSKLNQLIDFANVLFEQKYYKEAAIAYKKVFEIIEQDNSKDVVIKTKTKEIMEAEIMRKQLKDYVAMRLFQVYQAQEDFVTAEEYLSILAESYASTVMDTAQTVRYSNMLLQIADINYSKLHNIKKTEEILLKWIVTAETLEDKSSLQIGYNLLGQIYQNQEDKREEAEKFFQKSLSYGEASESNLHWLNASASLLELYIQCGRHERAREFVMEMSKIATKPLTLYKLGERVLDCEYYEEAEALLSRSLQRVREIEGESPTKAPLLSYLIQENLASLFADSGRIDEAREKMIKLKNSFVPQDSLPNSFSKYLKAVTAQITQPSWSSSLVCEIVVAARMGKEEILRDTHIICTIENPQEGAEPFKIKQTIEDPNQNVEISLPFPLVKPGLYLAEIELFRNDSTKIGHHFALCHCKYDLA